MDSPLAFPKQQTEAGTPGGGASPQKTLGGSAARSHFPWHLYYSGVGRAQSRGEVSGSPRGLDTHSSQRSLAGDLAKRRRCPAFVRPPDLQACPVLLAGAPGGWKEDLKSFRLIYADPFLVQVLLSSLEEVPLSTLVVCFQGGMLTTHQDSCLTWWSSSAVAEALALGGLFAPLPKSD